MALTRLSISKRPTKSIIGLLRNNVIGTPYHGMMYQHLNVEAKIDCIAEPYFVSLGQEDDIRGTCCFCKRMTFNVGRSVEDSFYVRYLSFKDSFRAQVLTTRRPKKNNSIRQDIGALLNSEYLPGSTHGGPRIFYAYVDPYNVRSARLCKEFGFDTLRTFQTVIFSRLKLRGRKTFTLSKLGEAERPEMVRLLREFYKDYTLVSFENLFAGKEYYVIRDNSGGVLAGAQANPDAWRILKMSNPISDVLLRVCSALPFLRLLINRHFKFLAIDGLYYRRGAEHTIIELLEGLLSIHDLHTAFIPVDTGSSLYRRLLALDLGFTSQITKRSKVDVICKLINFSEEEIARFKSHPAYVSAIDIT